MRREDLGCGVRGQLAVDTSGGQAGLRFAQEEPMVPMPSGAALRLCLFGSEKI